MILLAILEVSDEIVIGFFSAVILGMTGAIGVLWKRMDECDKDRVKLWAEVIRKDK